MFVNTEINGWGGAGSLRKWRLVHHDDFVHLLVTADGFHKACGLILRGVLADELPVEDVAHERGFSRAGNTCHGAEHAERELGSEVLDIVVGDAFENDVALGFAAFFGDRDGLFPLEVIGCEGVFCRCKILGWAAVEELTTGNATAGADIHQLVGGADHGFLVFHDKKRVSFVTKTLHDLNEAGGVARVESDAGFVEDEKGIDEGCSEASREVDALDFAARERAGGSVEREVAEADFAEVVDAGNDLLMNKAGAGVRCRKFERLENRCKALERKRGDIGDRQSGWVDAEIQRIRLEATPMAFRAWLVTTVARKQHTDVHFIGFAFKPLKVAIDSIPVARVPGLARIDIRVSVNDKILIRLGKSLEGTHGIDAALATMADEIVLAFSGLSALKCADDSLGDRQ